MFFLQGIPLFFVTHEIKNVPKFSKVKKLAVFLGGQRFRKRFWEKSWQIWGGQLNRKAEKNCLFLSAVLNRKHRFFHFFCKNFHSLFCFSNRQKNHIFSLFHKKTSLSLSVFCSNSIFVVKKSNIFGLKITKK